MALGTNPDSRNSLFANSGKFVPGEGIMPDLTSMAASVGALLKSKQQTLAVSESAGGGLISASLVAVPGASAYYVGGVVVYTRVAQRGLLQVPDQAMEGIRASSEPYAVLNARTVREALGTTWALSETGASGPTGNRYGDSAGHSCIAVSGPGRASNYFGDGPQRPGGQHVAVCPGRPGFAGTMRPRIGLRYPG